MAQEKTAASAVAVVQDRLTDANYVPEETLLKAAANPISRYMESCLVNSFIGYWWKGIVASIIMLCALMAIILILALHQSRPLPNWPFTITLNSLISIMVVILKSCMLAIVSSGLLQTKWLWFERPRPFSHYVVYDKWCQGPTSAGELLWLLRGQQILSSIALMVIIISAAIDPFTQQVIQYYQSTAPSDVGGSATLPRTSVFQEGGTHIGAAENAPSNGMIRAVMAGFWTPRSGSNAVSASNCLTGNCSFTEPYKSVGICANCSDISSQVSGSCTDNSCSFRLDTGTVLNTREYMVASEASGATVTKPVGCLATRQFIWTNTSDVPGGKFTRANATCHGTGCLTSAAECYIYPCIQTYTAEVTNGILTEKTVSSIPMLSDGVFCYTNFRKDCLTLDDWAILSGVGIKPTENSGSDYILYCFSASDDYSGITPTCVYDFAFISWSSLTYFFGLSQFLSGSIVGDEPDMAVGPSDIYFLYNSGAVDFNSIATAFASLSQSMTAHIRASGKSNYSEPVKGAVFYTQTLIRVQWVWLTLPLSLVAITLLFMVLVMVQMSTKGRRPLGDAFSLSLLFKGVAENVLDQLQDSGDESRETREEVGGEVSHGEQQIAESNIAEVQVQMVKVDREGWKLAKL